MIRKLEGRERKRDTGEGEQLGNKVNEWQDIFGFQVESLTPFLIKTKHNKLWQYVLITSSSTVCVALGEELLYLILQTRRKIKMVKGHISEQTVMSTLLPLCFKTSILCSFFQYAVWVYALLLLFNSHKKSMSNFCLNLHVLETLLHIGYGQVYVLATLKRKGGGAIARKCTSVILI